MRAPMLAGYAPSVPVVPQLLTVYFLTIELVG